jgi:hypothetical protein
MSMSMRIGVWLDGRIWASKEKGQRWRPAMEGGVYAERLVGRWGAGDRKLAVGCHEASVRGHAQGPSPST